MLLAKNERQLAAQAMHESGNLHYNANNLRAVYKCWNEALDLILKAEDVIHTWRDMFKDAEDISHKILQWCGIWGCVLAGTLTSNIAQFILTSDLGLRTECCFLSGYLFKVLPLLTLNQYFATVVCRDLQRTVDGRILKCRVLVDLGLFTEAFLVLQRLLHGERLPHIGDSSFRQVESKIIPTKFDTRKTITEPCNLKVLENVLDKRLSSNLGMLYGPHIVQTHLFTCLAQTIPVLPNIEDVIVPEGGNAIMKQLTMSTVSKHGMGTARLKWFDAKSKKSQKASKSDKDDNTIYETEEEYEQDLLQRHGFPK